MNRAELVVFVNMWLEEQGFTPVKFKKLPKELKTLSKILDPSGLQSSARCHGQYALFLADLEEWADGTGETVLIVQFNADRTVKHNKIHLHY